MKRGIIAACILAFLASPAALAAPTSVARTVPAAASAEPLARMAATAAKPAAAKTAAKPVGKKKRKFERKKFTPKLEAIRKRMNDKKKVSFSELQSLSKAGEGLASFFLAQRLEGGSETKTLDSIVKYYALAIRQGRTMAVSSLVSNLRAHGKVLSASSLKAGEQALVSAAKGRGKQADDAAFALGEFYASDVPFGRDQKKSLAMLRTSAKLGNADAAFKAGLMLTNGEGVDKDEKAGRELLRSAARNGNWAAEALLAQGEATQ